LPLDHTLAARHADAEELLDLVGMRVQRPLDMLSRGAIGVEPDARDHPTSPFRGIHPRYVLKSDPFLRWARPCGSLDPGLRATGHDSSETTLRPILLRLY